MSGRFSFCEQLASIAVVNTESIQMASVKQTETPSFGMVSDGGSGNGLGLAKRYVGRGLLLGSGATCLKWR
jgi:hypothetical protein